MQFLLCLSLLGCIFSLCTGDVPPQCVNDGKINPTALSKCDQLYSLLEKGLVSNSENMYALRRTFYPQVGQPAALLIITYNVTSNEELFATGNTSFEITIARSSYSLFSVINPYVLLEFVSGYILIFVERNFEAEKIVISLDATTTDPVHATEHEMVETLEILTARLEAYAKEQGRLTDWDGTGRGYTWEYEYLSQWFWLFLVMDIFLSVIASFLPSHLYGTLTKVLKNLTKEDTCSTNSTGPRQPMEDERKAPLAVIIALAVVLTVICILEFACSVYITIRAATICPSKACQREVISTRIAILCFTTGTGIVGSLLFGIIKGSLSRNGFCGKLKKSAKEFCIIAGFSTIFVLITVNLVPTIILGFIFPFEIITGLIYLLLVLFIVLIFTGIDSHVSSEWGRINRLLKAAKHQGEGNGQTESGYWKDDKNLPCFTASAFYVLYHVFMILIIIVFVSITSIIFVISLAVYSAEVAPSFAHTYYTLIPPMILFLLTTLAKKHVIDKVDPPRANKKVPMLSTQ